MDEQSVEVKIGREARCPTCPGAGGCVCVCVGGVVSPSSSPPPPPSPPPEWEGGVVSGHAYLTGL